MRRLIRIADGIAGCVVLAAAALAMAAAGLPPGFTNAPLPGVAGEAARSARTSQVQYLSPAAVTVAARRTVPVELHFEVTGGFHINSHRPKDKTLLPTRLVTGEGEGVEVIAVRFPQGESYSPAFAPAEKLSVYSGNFTVRVLLRAQPGQHTLQPTLHYQACDVNACLPPRTLPIEITVNAK